MSEDDNGPKAGADEDARPAVAPVRHLPHATDPNLAILSRNERELEQMKAFQRQIAVAAKARYDGYIEAGFTPEQALELVKGLNPYKP